jgi:hypothetical protein
MQQFIGVIAQCSRLLTDFEHKCVNNGDYSLMEIVNGGTTSAPQTVSTPMNNAITVTTYVWFLLCVFSLLFVIFRKTSSDNDDQSDTIEPPSEVMVRARFVIH